MGLAPRRTSLLAAAWRGLARGPAARPAAMIAVLLAAACARMPAPRSRPAPSTTIAFFRATRAAAIPRALRQAATGAGLRAPCAFVWGAVLATGGEARRTEVFLGDVPLSGWIVCAGALRSLTRDPPAARLEWRDGELRECGPDGSWRFVTSDELAARRGGAGAGSHALFSLRPTEKVTAAGLAPTLVRLAASLRPVLWELPAP